MPPVLEGRVALFGAGGPVAACAAVALRPHYTLRLSDVRPLPEIIREGRPQSPGAPLPELPLPPHEWMVTDIGDYEAVLAAARGMDALVNCTVVRADPVLAFRVNMVGAFNIARAAVELGIRRIIQTAPQMVLLGNPADYWWDFDVPDDAPERPGGELYTLTKFLGSKVLQVYAERHGLEVAEFRYCAFRPARAPGEEGTLFPFTTAWEDTGAPFLHALRAPSAAFERPLERFHLPSAVPQGAFSARKAARLLGWSPGEDFAPLYTRTAGPSPVNAGP
jgi:hypothetical protein